jgi:hypothetical protein
MIASYAPPRRRPLLSAALAIAVLGLGALSFTRSPAQAQAQPASAEFNHVEYRFTGYTADDSGVARTGPNTRLEVIWGDEPATPDVPKAPAAAADRLTLIIRDEARVPLVARLIKPDALRLRADLHQAIASRAADQADPRQAKSLKPDPASPELVMAHERLTPGADGLSPFTITRFYVHPTTTEQPHLPIEITFETVIAGGDMAWAAAVKMPIAAARTLLSDIEAAFAKRQVALPDLPAPTTAKDLRARAGADLAYRFNLGGGLKSSGQWISGSGSTRAEVVRDADHVRLRFFDPARRDMADEPVADLRLTPATARQLFTDLKAAADAPFDLKAWAARVAPRLKRTPEQVEASVLADEQAREGSIRLNINRQAMQFVANRPPFADETHVLSAHPRGSLDATRVCLMLSPEASKHTSQNCTMIAYMTPDAARALAKEGLKAAE